MKELFVLSGLPGCGKSTWAKEFCKIHQNVFIVSSDQIRYEIGGAYQYFKEENRVWELFLSRPIKLAEDNKEINVILDSTCLKNELRLKYLNMLNLYFDKNTLVYFDIPYNLCCERNKKHIPGKIVRSEVMESMYNTMERPSKEVLSAYSDNIVVK